MNRRLFLLRTLAALGSLPLAGRLTARLALPADPFKLGVASGDCTADSAVLWTRLAPEPLAARGGMQPVDIPVDWIVARDPALKDVVRQGRYWAGPRLAHSVHIELDGLQPGKAYWYQFNAGGHHSAIGQTRTLPAATANLAKMRFATTSCQNYTHGHFGAYRHMVDDAPDFVVHLGDYIYDTSFGETYRRHETETQPESLDEFRQRHALYKTDTDLQLAHTKLPFYTTIDNHDAIEDADPTLLAKRTAAYQAWYEHMPVRGFDINQPEKFDLHRKIVLGKLAQLCFLDSRQFRDQRAPCNGDYDPSYGFGNYRERCDIVMAENRSMLGQAQEQWLGEQLQNNAARWNVIASPGPFLPFSYQEKGQDLRYVGAWDAYPANRRRVADHLAAAGNGHPLILSGDIHSFWAMDGRQFADPAEQFDVSEFVTSSISANWPAPLAEPVSDNLGNNPQVEYYESAYRGYLLHDINARNWTVTARGVIDAKIPSSGVKTLATFDVAHGQPGFQQR